MKNNTVQIVVKSLHDGPCDDHSFLAEIKNGNQLWAHGRTMPEAVGNLIIQRQKELNFKVSNSE